MDLAKRMQRWQEVLETHKDDADVVLPRLRELWEKRDNLTATMEKIVPVRPIPAHLYSEATIRKFLGVAPRDVPRGGQHDDAELPPVPHR